MVPVEWPIAAAPEPGGQASARGAGRGRLPTVRADFFLDKEQRLTEQERALMTGMLSGLVAALADELRALLPDGEPANDDGDRLFDRLWGAGLLDIEELVLLLLRRAEEERIAAGVQSGGGGARRRFVQSLVSDDDPDISAAAMALILARGRRRDRFDRPQVTFEDLSAETAVALANAIAAGLRRDMARRSGAAEADERLSAAVQALLSTHDEGNRVEAKVFNLVHALDRAGRADDRLLAAVLDEGETVMLVELLARRGGIGFEAAWEHFTGGGRELALLLRLAGLPRGDAAEVVTRSGEVLGRDAEREIRAFDDLTDEEVEQARKWLRLDPAYRMAIRAISGDGQRAL